MPSPTFVADGARPRRLGLPLRAAPDMSPALARVFGVRRGGPRDLATGATGILAADVTVARSLTRHQGGILYMHGGRSAAHGATSATNWRRTLAEQIAI